MRQIFSIVFLAAILAFTQSCNPQTDTTLVQTSLEMELKEVMPGFLEGYLAEEELPNSLLLVPPPPEEGSAAWQMDQEMAAFWVETADESRWEQAAIDAELRFPDALKAFNQVLEIEISEEASPHLYILMRRVMADAGITTSKAKHHYQRVRPFMVNETPTCAPGDEEYLRKDGSYPSGHTSIGWAWALVLTELFPEQADELMGRGRDYGFSRMACNVHWYSDILAGRMCGAAAVARLHANETFLADMAAAREEINAIQSPVTPL